MKESFNFLKKIACPFVALGRRFSAWFGEPEAGLEPPGSRLDKLFQAIGIHLPVGRRDTLHVRPRFFKVLALIGIGIVLALVGLVSYSTSPSFCNSCHIMKPYYRAWATSKHNFVACVDCHYPPETRDKLWTKFQNVSQIVKYVTRTYGSKPYAEIEDAACLRSGCHATRLLQGRVTFKRDIIFDHRPHLEEKRRGRQLRCTSCHSQIVVGTHIEVTEDTCFLCHFKGMTPREVLPIGQCPLCHRAPERDIKVAGFTFSHKAFVGAAGPGCQKCHQDVIQGEGKVPKDRCFNCHNEPRKLDKFADMPLVHDRHVARGNIECARCHEPIQHAIQPATVPIQVDCASCHQTMHKGDSMLYAGTGGKGAPAMPSPMFSAQVDCIACHIIPTPHRGAPAQAEFSERTFKASEAACISCHNESYKGMKDKWVTTINAAMKEFEPKLREAEKKLQEAGQTTKGYREAVNLFDAAKHNFDFLKQAHGVHNIYYAARLLQVANESLDKAGKTLGYEPMKLDRNSLVSGGFCATLCHEQVKVKLPEKMPFNSTMMPHELHFTKFKVGCANCHELGQHKEVKRKIDATGCLKCHHSLEPPKCANCHTLQAGLYQGKARIDAAVTSPNIMAKQVDCTGCHDLSQRYSYQAVANRCAACHGEPYRSVLKSWQQMLNEAAAQAQGAIKAAETSLALIKGTRIKTSEAEKLLTAAKKELANLSKGKGLHNPEAAQAILASVEKKAQQASAILEKKRP